MIYLLSDLHGEANFSGLKDYIEKSNDHDLLIILGDVGLQFEEVEENFAFTKFFLSIKKNIALIDGNHENFKYLNSFPVEEWNGGFVGRLTPNIVHLKRGNVYDINGKTFFVFGGCKSSPKWKEKGIWYEGEEPTAEELSLAYNNLKKVKYKVDYILTHKYEQLPPRGTVCEDLQKLNSFIEEKVDYKHWYAGHWHIDQQLDSKHTFVYDRLLDIGVKN